MERIGGVKSVIEHQGLFLLIKDSRSTDDFWCFPDGGIERGEDLFSALKREMIEETNIEPEIGNLLFVQQIQFEDRCLPPEFFFHVTNGEDYLEHDVANSSHGNHELAAIDWVDVTQIEVRPDFMKTKLPEAMKHDFDIKTEVRLSPAS